MKTPLNASDALLFDWTLTPNEKIVAAHVLGHPTRNPSQREIATALGLTDTTVCEVQRSLNFHAPQLYRNPNGYTDILDRDAADDSWFDVPGFHYKDGQPVRIPMPAFAYERPAEWFERRAPDDPRFREPNRLVHVAPRFETAHPSNSGKTIELPWSIYSKFPRGTGVKNASNAKLVGLVYAREQLTSGAIPHDDYALATLTRSLPSYGRWLDSGRPMGLGPDGLASAVLHFTGTRREGMNDAIRLTFLTRIGQETTNTRPVAVVRRWLTKKGILVAHRLGDGQTVYTMPGATDNGPLSLDDFDPAKTKKMRRVPVGPISFDVLASESGHDYLQLRLQREGAERAFKRLWNNAGIAPYGTGWNTLDAMLDALADTHEKPEGGLAVTSKRDTPLPLNGTVVLLLTTEEDLKPSVGSDDHREPSTTVRDGEERAATTKMLGHLLPPRRDYGERWFGTWCFASDNTHACLIRFRDALEAKYGHADAAEVWRAIFLKHGGASKGSGLKILEGLRHQHAQLDPDATTDGSWLDALHADGEAA